MTSARPIRAVRALGWLFVMAGLACGSNKPTDDPTDDPSFRWTSGQPCPLARFEASGVVVDGELWVMGGFTSSSLTVTRRIDIYNPEANTWRRTGDLDGAQTHMAVATIGSEIIFAGGFPDAFSPRRPPTTDVILIDTASGNTRIGPPLPQGGAAFAFAVTGTELHLAGGLGPDGETDADVHWVWDVANSSTWAMAMPLPTLRNHGGGTAVGGVFYAVAGRQGWDETAGDVANVDAFDPATGVWTPRAPIPSARSEIGAATSTMVDGRILVVGGSLPGIKPSADVFVYDPSTDAWSTLRALPEKRKGAVAAQIGNRIIVTTGSPTSTDPSATTFVGCCL